MADETTVEAPREAPVEPIVAKAHTAEEPAVVYKVADDEPVVESEAEAVFAEAATDGDDIKEADEEGSQCGTAY